MKSANYFIIYISIISRTYCIEFYSNIIVTHTQCLRRAYKLTRKLKLIKS